MNVISAEGLKEKLDRGDEFKLVMVLPDFAYAAAHIPGSINVNHIQDIDTMLDPSDDIVVYCSNVNCIASRAAYNYLEAKGYKSIQRFAGGLEGWQDAGFPLEGTAVHDV